MSTLQEMQISPGIVDAINAEEERQFWCGEFNPPAPKWNCLDEFDIFASREDVLAVYAGLQPVAIGPYTLSRFFELAGFAEVSAVVLRDRFGNEIERYPV